MNKMEEYEVFIDHGTKQPPHGYKKITVHVVFDVKYDGRMRARCMGGRHLTQPEFDTPYSGITNLKNIKHAYL